MFHCEIDNPGWEQHCVNVYETPANMSASVSSDRASNGLAGVGTIRG